MKIQSTIKLLLLLGCMLHISQAIAFSYRHPFHGTDSIIFQRIINYAQLHPQTGDTLHTNCYTSYHMKTDRRNVALPLVPTMYAISRGKREFAGETFSHVDLCNNTLVNAVTRLDVGTIPHNRKAMPSIIKYIHPNIYGVTLFNRDVLSPFHEYNTSLYRYSITHLTDDRAEIVFMPKHFNTQLVSGRAIADKTTGRLLTVKFEGEHDLLHFRVEAEMAQDSTYTLLPKVCDFTTTFRFIGNKITSTFHTVFNVPSQCPDTLTDIHDMKMMEQVRPERLSTVHCSLYDEHQRQSSQDTSSTRKDNGWWRLIEDHVVNKTRGNFGSDGQGSFKISPIFNPLFLSYSQRKGITYKLKLDAEYCFSENHSIEMSFNAGYSFKQDRFYFKWPVKYTFNKKRNIYLRVETGQGNRITNANIVEQVKHEQLDNIDWNSMNLDYFKDFYVKVTNNYDLSDYVSLQPGMSYHRRSAVDKTGFAVAGRPTKYYSFAPTLQLQYRPMGWHGPIITADYERGVDVGNAHMNYERVEMDLSWQKKYHSLQCLALRLGGGCYTSKSKDSYFLDYANFRENNIPGGWNDDWACDFQLLNSNWYNASKYYVRTNVTYESPLMLLAKLPWVGHIIEMERIYMNTLFVEHLHPYVEYGYGFTNRFFSMGVFLSTRNSSFGEVGCRFAFELFRNW